MESEQPNGGSDRITPSASGYEASITLPPENTSVREARHFLAEQLRTEPADLLETATLLVSELVTNAIRHAHTETEIGVLRRDEIVRVEVADSSTAPATLADRGVTAPSGRGLRIVDALATAWGVEPHGGGKVVWFELDARAAERREDGEEATGTAPVTSGDSVSGARRSASAMAPCAPT